MGKKLLNTRKLVIDKKQQLGFTLIELIVVMTIIGSLLAIASLGFNSWQKKYNVEAQVKQMVQDINEYRVTAMTRKQKHSVNLNANSYVFRSYSSEEESLAAGTIVNGGTRNVSYGLKSDATTFYNNTRFEIDQRGMITPVGTVYLDNSDSAYLNCFTLHTVRTNVGGRNPTWSNCDDR